MPNSRPLKGNEVKKPPIPTTPNKPRAHEGQAGAINPAIMPVLPIPKLPFNCLLTKKILIERTIPPRKPTKSKKIKEIPSIETNRPRVNFNQRIIENLERSSL